MYYITIFINYIRSSTTFKGVLLAILCDIIFGCFRAARQRSWNSCVGIDGAIRKISMMVAAVFAGAIDLLVDIDLLAFLPITLQRWLSDMLQIENAGIMSILCLLFIAYEIISILKNMVLCGLPVRSILKIAYDFLHTYTNELPDIDGLNKPEQKDDI